VAVVLGLTLIGMLVLALWIAIASLDDRPPNVAGGVPHVDVLDEAHWLPLQVVGPRPSSG
jgi:hypothetical protein